MKHKDDVTPQNYLYGTIHIERDALSPFQGGGREATGGCSSTNKKKKKERVFCDDFLKFSSKRIILYAKEYCAASPIIQLKCAVCMHLFQQRESFLRQVILVLLFFISMTQAYAQLTTQTQLVTPEKAQQPVISVTLEMQALLGVKPPVSNIPLDESLKSIGKSLESSEYSGLEKISDDIKTIRIGSSVRFPINAIYSLLVEAPEDLLETGIFNLKIEMIEADKIINALSSQAKMIPGKNFILKGIPLQPGELIVVLSLKSGNDPYPTKSNEEGDKEEDEKDDQQQDSSPEEQEQESLEEDKEKQQDKTDTSENEPQDQQQGEENADKETDDASLQSLLESLEEVDRREQKEIRNVRDRIDFKGGWW